LIAPARHVWKPLLHEIASGALNNETDSVEFIAHARRHHYRYRIGEVVGLNRRSVSPCRPEH